MDSMTLDAVCQASISNALVVVAPVPVPGRFFRDLSFCELVADDMPSVSFGAETTLALPNVESLVSDYAELRCALPHCRPPLAFRRCEVVQVMRLSVYYPVPPPCCTSMMAAKVHLCVGVTIVSMIVALAVAPGVERRTVAAPFVVHNDPLSCSGYSSSVDTSRTCDVLPRNPIYSNKVDVVKLCATILCHA